MDINAHCDYFCLPCCSADGQEAERKTSEEEIQGLKQQVLERDLKICKFVDITLDEPK